MNKQHKGLTIQEVLDARTEVQRKIAAALDEFTEKTGLLVESLDVVTINLNSMGKWGQYQYRIDACVRLGWATLT